MTPVPTPPDSEDCIYCDLLPEDAVSLLRRMINEKSSHTICAGCRKAMGDEVTRQLNRTAQAPSRKWD